MKKIYSLILILCLAISLFSCGSEESQPITLTNTNYEDYLNVEISFGDFNVQAVEEPIGLLSNTTETNYYVNCLCYVTITPKSDYSFKDASIGFKIEKSGWEVEYSIINPTVKIGGTKQDYDRVYLDKDGYGVCSVLLTQKTTDATKLHPLKTSTKFTLKNNASGTVTEK